MSRTYIKWIKLYPHNYDGKKGPLNSQRAKDLEDTLSGSTVGSWLVRELLGHGKSAAVFRGESANSECALKVFDTEIVERYGRITQLRRIEREVSLSCHTHPNLVKIYEGGECESTGNLYVAMQLIDAPSLASVVSNLRREQIRSVIRDVARAARYLEALEIAHRDIKPENIAVAEYGAILLDLGVLRSIAHPGGTDDGDEQPFVGTLQYSPPEFLLRVEEDSLEGWRAVTFYQLGAVLYDLIERKTIFSNFAVPYAQMVNAVQNEMPIFLAQDVPTDLVHLAERCLLKDPSARLELVSWDDFDVEPVPESPAEMARKTLTLRQRTTSSQNLPLDPQMEEKVALEESAEQIQKIIRNEFVTESTLPPITVYKVRQQASDARFSFSFVPNPSVALDVHFAVEFIVDLIDPTARAFRLSAAAWVSKEAIDPSVSRKEHSEVYAGLLHQEQVAQAVLNFVLPAFVEALDVQEVAGEQGECSIGVKKTVAE